MTQHTNKDYSIQLKIPARAPNSDSDTRYKVTQTPKTDGHRVPILALTGVSVQTANSDSHRYPAPTHWSPRVAPYLTGTRRNTAYPRRVP